jgi:hypothetical protein
MNCACAWCTHNIAASSANSGSNTASRTILPALAQSQLVQPAVHAVLRADTQK